MVAFAFLIKLKLVLSFDCCDEIWLRDKNDGEEIREIETFHWNETQRQKFYIPSSWDLMENYLNLNFTSGQLTRNFFIE